MSENNKKDFDPKEKIDIAKKIGRNDRLAEFATKGIKGTALFGFFFLNLYLFYSFGTARQRGT
jgi:hypothetical protein